MDGTRSSYLKQLKNDLSYTQAVCFCLVLETLLQDKKLKDMVNSVISDMQYRKFMRAQDGTCS